MSLRDDSPSETNYKFQNHKIIALRRYKIVLDIYIKIILNPILTNRSHICIALCFLVVKCIY